jgi:tRNA threonylcarbamoyl adenosine modification protein YeaZ
MIRLSIDTAFEQLSFALSKDDEILAQYHISERRRNASMMFQKLKELMNHAGIKPNQIDIFVVNQGPGSYTGVRIGMALVNTLAQVFQKPVLPVNSLRLLASQIKEEINPFLVLLNCTREELFVSEFQNKERILTQLTPITLKSLNELQDHLNSKPVLLQRIQGSNERWNSSFKNIESMSADHSRLDATLLDQTAADGLKHKLLELVQLAQPLYIKRDV